MTTDRIDRIDRVDRVDRVDRLDRIEGGEAAATEPEAEQALRASEEAFRALFEASPVASLITSASGRQIWMANGEAKRLLGVDSRGVEALDPLSLFDDPAAHASAWRALHDSGAVRDLEARLRLGGEARDCVVSARLIPHHGQRVALVSLADVTDRKRQEASLRQAQKLESLGVLSGGIAHDFNNLLTPVIANLTLAREHLEAAHPARELVDDVLASAGRAAELVRQLLTYAGKGQARVEPHDLGRLVEDMMPLLSVAASNRGRLALDLAADTPKVDVDATQLGQLALNLVTNASEAIGAGAGRIRLSIRPVTATAEALARLRAGHDLAPGEHVVLEVSDEGPGMSTETLERIFDPFFTTKEPGRGLGLSALLGIVRAHRAGIEVETEIGRGSTFRVWFRSSATVRAPRRTAPFSGRPKLRGRVLLADDDPAVRASARRLLVHLGLDVVATADGAEAVAAFEREPFDLVLLDVNMPAMDGLEALERIRARSADVPCVLCSGYSDRDVAMPEGARLSFLSKPYSMQDVYRCLADALAPAESGATR